MNPEQRKVREFFKRYQNKDTKSWATWFLICFFVFIMLIACVVPVQAYTEVKDSGDAILLVMLTFVGPAVACMRIQPYTMYMENQKGRQIFDLIKYYPIDKKEIKKMKTIYMIRFMTKLLPFCMLAQIPATIYDYGKLSVLNFLYILAIAFVWPVIMGMFAIWTER